jgi:hypothetical protein
LDKIQIKRNAAAAAGLPDSLFSNQKSQCGKKYRGLRLENGYIFGLFGLFYGYLGFFMTIRYILCSFGTFFPVLVSCTKKNLATLSSRRRKKVLKGFQSFVGPTFGVRSKDQE